MRTDPPQGGRRPWLQRAMPSGQGGVAQQAATCRPVRWHHIHSGADRQAMYGDAGHVHADRRSHLRRNSTPARPAGTGPGPACSRPQGSQFRCRNCSEAGGGGRGLATSSCSASCPRSSSACSCCCTRRFTRLRNKRGPGLGGVADDLAVAAAGNRVRARPGLRLAFDTISRVRGWHTTTAPVSVPAAGELLPSEPDAAPVGSGDGDARGRDKEDDRARGSAGSETGADDARRLTRRLSEALG